MAVDQSKIQRIVDMAKTYGVTRLILFGSMAKTPALTAVHHLMVRGIERRKIFAGDDDRDHFLHRLGEILQDAAVSNCGQYLLDMPDSSSYNFSVGERCFINLNYRIGGGNDG